MLRPKMEVECNGDSGVANLTVEVAHAIPGRLRLRIAELKERPQIADQLRQSLGSLAQLKSLEINARSGSMVFQYDPTAQSAFAASLRRLLPSLDDITPCKRSQSASPNRARDFASEIAGFLRQANEGVEKATGGVDLKVLVPIALLAFSILGVAVSAMRQRKLPMPTWYDLLWFAFNTFVILNMTMSKRSEYDPAENADETE